MIYNNILLDIKIYSLLAAYETGSFLAAANQLSITQPAVSQHIKIIEQDLGVVIFQRTNSGLKITKEGKYVVEVAKKMLGIYNSLKQDLHDITTKIDHFTIGVTHTVESNPITQALAKYCSENNNINIRIITDTVERLYKRLKAYELDLIIVGEKANDKNIEYLLLDTDQLILAVDPHHRLAKRKSVSVNELKKENLISRLPTSATSNIFKSFLDKMNIEMKDFNIIMELDNIATIKDLIRKGFGVSILPKSVCLDEIKKKKIIAVPINNLSIVREMEIAFLSDFPHKEILKNIVDAYNKTVKVYE